MKFKRRIKNNVILSFLMTLLVVMVIDFSFVPQTNSKFVKSGGEGEYGIALKYNIALHSLYGERKSYEYTLPEDTTLPTFTVSADKKKFTIDFSISRQKKEATGDVAADKKDVYNISLVNSPTSCSITTNVQASYDQPNNSNEKIPVTVECDEKVYTKGNDIKFSVKVTEQIGTEASFDYADYDFTIKEAYYKNKMGIVDWKNPLIVNYTNDDDLNSKFVEWIEGFIEQDKTVLPAFQNKELIVKEYFHIQDGTYTTYIKEGATNWQTEIKGLSKTVTGSRNKKYTFTMDDNIFGYIRTARDTNDYQMYFYVDDEERANAIFKYYLEAAINTDTNEKLFTESEINEIIEYVKARGGISSILKGKTIPGFTYIAGDHRLVLNNDLIGYVQSLKKYGEVITVRFEKFAVMLDEFVKELPNSEASQILSPRFLNTAVLQNAFIMDNLTVRQAIAMNNTEQSPTSFVSYHVLYDDTEGYEQFVIIKIFSDYSQTGHTQNYYQISKLNLQQNFDISFENDATNPDKLTINFIVNRYDADGNEVYSATTDAEREAMAKAEIESAAITLRKYFPDIGTLNETTGEVENVWGTSTIYGTPTFTTTADGWEATFIVSKDLASLMPEQTASVEGSSTKAVQESINKVTAAVDTASEGMKDNNIVNEVEENSGFSMVSSIMKLLFEKE